MKKTEKRFIREFADKEICEIILNLPLSNLPSVIQAVRSFYSSPNDPFLGQILSEQIRANFQNISSNRIDFGISTYIRFLKDELANLNDDVREKISVHTALKIQDNTAQIVDILGRFLEQTEFKEKKTDSYINKQLTKIISYSGTFRVLNSPTDEQAIVQYFTGIARQIFQVLGYAFLDTCEISSNHDFNFLLTMVAAKEEDQSVTLQLELICHISPFVGIFDELISTLFYKSDDEFLTLTNKYPSDLKIKMEYKWAENIPYRVTRIGSKAIRFECLDSNLFKVKFPMKTSDLLVIISAMLNGKKTIVDDFNFSQSEIEFMNYIDIANEHGVDLSNFEINASEPETWSINISGIQNI